MRSPKPFNQCPAPAAFGRGLGVMLICAAFIGCTPPPDLRTQVSQVDASTPWPTLFTSAQLAQTTAATPTRSGTYATRTADLAARAAALRIRARNLSSGPVLDNASRKRLQAAVARHP